jgi:hypothetical protein
MNVRLIRIVVRLRTKCVAQHKKKGRISGLEEGVLQEDQRVQDVVLGLSLY